jgi:hypothetical protein
MARWTRLPEGRSFHEVNNAQHRGGETPVGQRRGRLLLATV